MAGNQSKSNAGGRGGARKGAGRPKGAVTKRTREIAEKAFDEGITPLEFMLKIMRTEPRADMEPKDFLSAVTLRFEAAKAAAPYMHPRLAAVEHSGPDGAPLQPPVLNVVIGEPEDAAPAS